MSDVLHASEGQVSEGSGQSGLGPHWPWWSKKDNPGAQPKGVSMQIVTPPNEKHRADQFSHITLAAHDCECPRLHAVMYSYLMNNGEGRCSSTKAEV